MYHRYPIPPTIIIIILLFLMMLDARLLGAVVCIPAGILMLSQCHTEDTDQYDPLAFVGGIGMLFFGICIAINYIL